MKLNKRVAYEKLGNEVYLSLDDEIFILDNEVSTFIFELLKVGKEVSSIKEKVIAHFSNTDNYSNEEKEQFVEEFLTELHKKNIITTDY